MNKHGENRNEYVISFPAGGDTNGILEGSGRVPHCARISLSDLWAAHFSRIGI